MPDDDYLVAAPLDPLGFPHLARRQTQFLGLTRPLNEFIARQSAGGVALILATFVALFWANSPWSEQYHALLETHLVVDLSLVRVDETLHFWVNDVAMVLFFFLVGMEIKRELVAGELRGRQRVTVPLAAALGGMLVPALVFLIVARDPAARTGWAIPMATDIAFALGVMALLGPRIPESLKAFLLAVAIFDDLGAVIIIALFFTEAIEPGPLLVGAAIYGGILLVHQLGVRQLPLYMFLGVGMWLAILESGVHPTVVGVLLGLATPWRSWYRPAGYPAIVRPLIERFEKTLESSDQDAREQRRDALISISELSVETVSPLDRLEHELHPWVAFLVVPAFALANAGVTLGGTSAGDIVASPVTWGVALALLIGKPIGILTGYVLAVRALRGQALEGLRARHVASLGVLAGIGFTISLFLAELSYTDAVLVREAKLGILLASIVAGLAGASSLFLVTRERDARQEVNCSGDS